jgi:hypothetical protein
LNAPVSVTGTLTATSDVTGNRIFLGPSGGNSATATQPVIRGIVSVDGQSGSLNPGQFFLESQNSATGSRGASISFVHYASDTGQTGILWSLDGNGNVHVSGTFTAGTKNFRIVHPLDDTKYLTHSSLEGPEICVFYRGEGQTDASGLATITLPDYFEGLTLPTGRTVQLTEIFEDDVTDLGKLAASRVVDGSFRVRSEYAGQLFCWEVKAIRADVPELEVVTDAPVKVTPQPMK